MLVVKVELWPRGDSSRRQRLGTMTIANDGTGTPTRGNYLSVLTGKRGIRLGAGRLRNFPRKRLLAWDLVGLMLRDIRGTKWGSS